MLVLGVVVIALVGLPAMSSEIGPANLPTQSANATNDALVVPVKIDTFGPAWNGYLAYGLWQFNSSLSPLHSYLVVMNTNGQLLHLRRSNDIPSYWPVKYVAEDTLMFMGEPDSLATHFWNMKTNKTTDFPNVWGHHDIIYNPNTRTFLTVRDYIRQIDGKNVLMDKIDELDAAGNILWSWDTYGDGHINLSDECQCNDTSGSSSGYLPGPTLIDLTHSNSLQWNFTTNVIYLNMRAQNTFCKIEKTTSRLVWCLGEHGNFTLYDSNGQKKSSLWYHSHHLVEVRPDVFTMFDNDYHNTTLPCPQTFNGTDLHSRMLEISVDEQNKTAHEIWNWDAPSTYWTPYWGSVNILPNGDFLGAFGANSHYVTNSTGGVVVEVNPEGQVVRTYTFPYGWGLYRVEPIAMQSATDYDGKPHTGNFTINISTKNALAGIQNIYYRINNGPTKSVNVDGQPQITTQGLNNTLEYWGVDKTGIEEAPHKILTNIQLIENTTSTQSYSTTNVGFANITTGFIIAVILVVAGIVYSRKIKKRTQTRDLVEAP